MSFKKERRQLEKCRRKIEADLHISLEVVAEKEKEKIVLQQSLSRKEKEIKHMSAKVGDEQALIIKKQKDLRGRVEELEEEAEMKDNQELIKPWQTSFM
jgi:hypothetical protein